MEMHNSYRICRFPLHTVPFTVVTFARVLEYDLESNNCVRFPVPTLHNEYMNVKNE